MLPIEVKGLSVSYGNKRILTNMYMQVEAGHTYGLIGPNGAGKSTLFKAILGLLEPNAGEIKVFGAEVKHSRKRIAYVPQKDDIDWEFPASVKDIVLMGRYPHKGLLERLNKNDLKLAEEAMVELGIAELADRQIGQLSGGQQQRVFIARALCQQADLFFFDEPFVGVDMSTEERIVSAMKKMASEGKTLLVVHHDLTTVEQYFDKVILINQRLIALGDTKTAFTQENIARCYGAQLGMLQRWQ
ncbi:MAG: metal ABC transporter ATP-binding protein [Saprospiraceae bacterium]|nr:metal ABC transporter ATP-binding protein [Saprospiraceae bacterium]